ncbi:sensor histidine kinase [Larkinella insperata]|uniref:histidine kinase n=1 Tax=Larkinella insperata TaxID=332158 RepID=A0ABW3Q0P1_9BACT
MAKRTTLDKPFTITPTRTQNVVLNYRQNDFCIYFRANKLPPPYEYRLWEANVRYKAITANQYAFFTNIPAGEYEFSVGSVMYPQFPPARLRIRVDSPMWLQWWFLPMLFLYGLILISIIFYFLYRYRLRQFMRIHVVRENIARDLHDDMGSYLSSISILTQSVETLALTDPERARALVKKIGETARQVMDSMSDIIWSVNPDNDSMTQIVQRMRDVGADLLEEQDVLFSLHVNDLVLQSYLPLEQRRDFFLIYKEALHNIAKYAKAEQVWVRLERKENSLVLHIHDNGIGFEPQRPGNIALSGNGIKNMNTRASKMNAVLNITTQLGQGTQIVLHLPLP